MVYRTRTYIAADWDHDFDAVEQLRKGTTAAIGRLVLPMLMSFISLVIRASPVTSRHLLGNAWMLQNVLF